MRKLLKFLTGRLFISIVLVSLQIGVLVRILGYAKNDAHWLQFFSAFSFCMTLFLVTRDVNPAYKIGWMLIFMILPVYGVIFYILFGARKTSFVLEKRSKFYFDSYRQGTEHVPSKEGLAIQALASYDNDLARQANYITNISGFPVCGNTEVEYFPSGEDWAADMFAELQKAKSFIFMEFFIISEGQVWDHLLPLLVEKRRQGVEVKLMFDDVGSIMDVPSHYERKLRVLGLEVIAFNPLRAHLNSRLNSRDHRKVLVIDGNVGYTGGVNISDEYANLEITHGHWKDTAVRLRGEAVWNLTLMFLNLWSYASKRSFDFSPYMPTERYMTDGFVQPFGDNPLDNQNVAENVYIQTINMAKDYVWITTPYLVLDNEMITALKIAAQSGVDVRIVTPHIPDKKYVFCVTRDNYKVLIESGVKIFEYTPGFIHAKMFVCDDKVAIIGTINMDYRSFYLHFENGVVLYGSSAIKRVRDDIASVLELSQEVTVRFIRKIPFVKRLVGAVLRLTAPLL